MKARFLSVIFVGLVLTSTAAGEDNPCPGGWRMHSHYAPNLYRVGIDYEISHGGKWSGFLESADADYAKLHYASLVQSIDATRYRGKRLRLSAFVKTRDVKTRAEFEAAVPNPYADLTDRFKAKPPLEGTSDWKRSEVELTVHHYAKQIDICVELKGPGRVWMDDVSLEVLGDAADARKTTEKDADSPPALPDEPANPGFEQTQLEYHRSLMQGLWAIQAPPVKGRRVVTRYTRLVEGSKITDTDYFPDGTIWQQSTSTFELERAGRFSLMTLRNSETTAGMAKGQRWPATWSNSIPYTVNRSQFVEILLIMGGDQGPPILKVWNRVAK